MVRELEFLKVVCRSCGTHGNWDDVKWFAQVTGEVGKPTVQIAVAVCQTCSVSQMVARDEL